MQEQIASLNGSGPRVPDSGASVQSFSLSIIVPVFNESRRVERGLKKLRSAIDHGPFHEACVEVILADDGSTDGTLKAAEVALASFTHWRIVRLPVNRGKGAAVRAGVAAAQGSTIVFMDADMAVPPSRMTTLLSALEDADIAIGSRTHSRSSIEAATAHRVLMGRTFHRIARSVVGVPYRDTQCGFKAFRAPVARLLFHFSGTEGFAFDVELLVLAQQLGMTVMEVPVHWQHVAGSRIRPLMDPTSMVADLIRIRMGSRAVPDVPGVVLPAQMVCADRWERALQIVGPTMPILPWERSGLLILFPLCDPTEVERLVSQLRTSFSGQPIVTVSLSTEQLETMWERHSPRDQDLQVVARAAATNDMETLTELTD